MTVTPTRPVILSLRGDDVLPTSSSIPHLPRGMTVSPTHPVIPAKEGIQESLNACTGDDRYTYSSRHPREGGDPGRSQRP